MSKELEALERVNKAFHTALIFADVKQKDEETEKALNIIETALKDYEKLKAEYDRLESIYTHFIKQYNQLMKDHSKVLKALEIIKEKRVQIVWLLEAETVEKYNEDIWTYNRYDTKQAEKYYLTQEEFDLLKEVLL